MSAVAASLPPQPAATASDATQRGHTLSLAGITQRFGNVVAAHDVTLDVGAGELVALLGPSGCGKTTLLRIIAGFIAQTAGSVRFDGIAVDQLPTSKRGVGIVFQNYALFPHLTVEENIAYGLQARHTPRDATRSKVREMLALVRMHDFATRLPRQLSGGQQQRIALARALATDPKILLLDEPFGALDKNLRLDMQIEVKRLQRAYGITTILVTHDQEEAMSMADRIAVLNHGNVEQCAPPVEIYDRPATLFVNQFVGTTNLLPVTVVGRNGDAVSFRFGDAEFDLRGPAVANTEVLPGARAIWSIRPERLRLDDNASRGRIAATIRAVLPLGPITVYEAEAGASSIKINQARDEHAATLEVGARIFIAPADANAGQLFTTH